MKYGSYPTPNDVRVFIGGVWIDDLYRIDINHDSKKIPLYDYSGRLFKIVATGKAIVTGSMIVHWRFPGYLTLQIRRALRDQQAAIEAAASQVGSGTPMPGVPEGANQVPFGPQPGIEPPQAPPLTRAGIFDRIQQVKQMTPEQRVIALMESHSKGLFDQDSVILDNLYSPSPNEGSIQMDNRNPEDVLPDQYIGGHSGFDMEVRYGGRFMDREGSVSYVVKEEIKGVHIVGRRKVFSASTSGGDMSSSGQSILEVYPFFAREINSVVSRDS